MNFSKFDFTKCYIQSVQGLVSEAEKVAENGTSPVVAAWRTGPRVTNSRRAGSRLQIPSAKARKGRSLRYEDGNMPLVSDRAHSMSQCVTRH